MRTSTLPVLSRACRAIAVAVAALAVISMPARAQRPVQTPPQAPAAPPAGVQGTGVQGTGVQATGMQATGVQASPVQPPVGYLFGPHDVINIAVVGRSDYNQQVLVQDDGTISLALIGPVTAANLTPLQLKGVIEDKLRAGGYYLKPEVTVTLSGAASQYAVLLGDIATPGLAALDRPYRLSELIARSGGVKPGADVVTVSVPGGDSREYSLKAIATNASPDPMVAPGTKIYVQKAQMFYIYGQVGAPGTYPIEPDMTVRNALARAGGLSALGSIGRIKIYRGDKELKGINLNQKLEPGDTINVGERFF